MEHYYVRDERLYHKGASHSRGLACMCSYLMAQGLAYGCISALSVGDYFGQCQIDSTDTTECWLGLGT